MVPGLAETVETGDKNRQDFHCMQMSLLMSMRFIFGDDCSRTCGNAQPSEPKGLCSVSAISHSLLYDALL